MSPLRPTAGGLKLRARTVDRDVTRVSCGAGEGRPAASSKRARMSRPRDFGPGKGAGDWSGNWRTLLMLWGFPGLAMRGALGPDPTPRAVIWTFILSAMGLAAIINFRRCGRTHCRFKGPFLLVMALSVQGQPNGWMIPGR